MICICLIFCCALERRAATRRNQRWEFRNAFILYGVLLLLLHCCLHRLHRFHGFHEAQIHELTSLLLFRAQGPENTHELTSLHFRVQGLDLAATSTTLPEAVAFSLQVLWSACRWSRAASPRATQGCPPNGHLKLPILVSRKSSNKSDTRGKWTPRYPRGSAPSDARGYRRENTRCSGTRCLWRRACRPQTPLVRATRTWAAN